jgi:menaquinone-dependent protoporphyrinogen IX oxidase
LLIFLLPIAILSIHALGDHKHTVCISKVENHVHEKDVDCNLHLLKQNDSFLPKNIDQLVIDTNIYTPSNLHYNFLKNHYKLSFSVRGPPVLV